MEQTTATHFATALQAWMTRERIQKGRAARWLGVSCRDLDSWLNGTLPAKDRITSVLERITRK